MSRNPIPLRPDPSAVNRAAMTTLTRSVICAAHSQLNPHDITTEAFVRRRGWGNDVDSIA